MAPRLKKFVAARDFSIGTHSFATGDEIPHGRILRDLLEFGTEFAVTDAPKEKPTDG